MRVLVVDESAERAELLRAALLLAGHEVTASLTSPFALLKTIEQLQPDVIVIDTDSPSRDVLEHLVMISQHTPRPVVMFASDGSPETIRAVDARRRRPPTWWTAWTRAASRPSSTSRWRASRSCRTCAASSPRRTSKLSERKLIERAKGLLMKSRNLDEEAAYAALRKSGDGSQAEASRSRAAHRRCRGSI